MNITEEEIRTQFNKNPDWEVEEVYDFFVKDWSKEKEKENGDKLLQKIVSIYR